MLRYVLSTTHHTDRIRNVTGGTLWGSATLTTPNPLRGLLTASHGMLRWILPVVGFRLPLMLPLEEHPGDLPLVAQCMQRTRIEGTETIEKPSARQRPSNKMVGRQGLEPRTN